MPKVSTAIFISRNFFFSSLPSGTVESPAPPHFDSRSRIFELDSCGGNGKVCLVYKNCTAGVVFLLPALQVQEECKTFSAF